MLRKILEFIKTIDPAQVKELMSIITTLMALFGDSKPGPFAGASGPDLTADEFVAECKACGCDEEEAKAVAAKFA